MYTFSCTLLAINEKQPKEVYSRISKHCKFTKRYQYITYDVDNTAYAVAVKGFMEPRSNYLKAHTRVYIYMKIVLLMQSLQHAE
jgi:hypothetical protein